MDLSLILELIPRLNFKEVVIMTEVDLATRRVHKKRISVILVNNCPVVAHSVGCCLRSATNDSHPCSNLRQF